jgi:two-component system, NtrC family, sensor histidine kinase KinB
MKQSIRTRFNTGMIFLFLIILLLSVFSGYYLNKLSQKNSAILKENYLSMVYAREMTEGILSINQEITSDFFSKRSIDNVKTGKYLDMITAGLTKEKHNITEPGEDKLVTGIDSGIAEFNDLVHKMMNNGSLSAEGIQHLQEISDKINQQLSVLSQMNGKALEVKTDDAKLYSKHALTNMTITASLCFLIGMSFSYSFAAYFNQRFSYLYEGIKQIVSSDFQQRLYFDGSDEFYEISLVINEMAAKLEKNKQKLSVTLPSESEKDMAYKDIEDIRIMLFNLKTLEEQASALLSRFKNDKD